MKIPMQANISKSHKTLLAVFLGSAMDIAYVSRNGGRVNDDGTDNYAYGTKTGSKIRCICAVISGFGRWI